MIGTWLLILPVSSAMWQSIWCVPVPVPVNISTKVQVKNQFNNLKLPQGRPSARIETTSSEARLIPAKLRPRLLSTNNFSIDTQTKEPKLPTFIKWLDVLYIADVAL